MKLGKFLQQTAHLGPEVELRLITPEGEPELQLQLISESEGFINLHVEVEPELEVILHLNSGMLRDPSNCPDLEDGRHVFYPALEPDDDWRETCYAELGEAIESGQLNPYYGNFYMFSRPEPDAYERLLAIKRYYDS